MVSYRLVKQKIYPNVHVLEHKFQLQGDSAVSTKHGTCYPVIIQDEQQGDPNSKYTNPESASFAESNEANCYPESRVNYARVDFEVTLTKGAIETDKVQVMKLIAFPIHMSFLENYTALNDATSEEVEDILKMQHETTDRQGYPQFNGTDLDGDFTTLGADTPGLTTDTKIEGVSWDINKIYDALQFYKNGMKVKKSIGRIRHLYVSRNRTLRFSYRIKAKNKRLNPYDFFGVALHVPAEDDLNSVQAAGDLTNIPHLNIKVTCRYNEWNSNFNAMR